MQQHSYADQGGNPTES